MVKKVYSVIFEIDATGKIKDLLCVVDKESLEQIKHIYIADGKEVISRDYNIFNKGTFKEYVRV